MTVTSDSLNVSTVADFVFNDRTHHIPVTF